MILLPSTRQRLARLPFLFRAHDCLDETGLFGLSYGQKVYAVFTRAGHAYSEDQTGRLVRVPSGMPRLHGQGAVTQLMLEGQGAQLFLRSQEFNHASWVKTDTTVSPDALVAPDGTMTADLLTEGVAGTALCEQAVTVASGATVAVSYFLRRGNHDWVRVMVSGTTASSGNNYGGWFNLATGAKGSTVANGTGSVVTSFIEEVGNYYRCTVVGAISGATTYVGFTVSASADSSTARVNSGTRYQWGAQAETALVPSSYMPTLGATAGRVADNLYFPFLLTPRALSAYVRGVELQHPAVVNVGAGGMLAIVDATGLLDGRIAIYKQNGAAGYRMLHDPATTTATTQIGTTVERGSVVETLGQLGADGAPTLRLSVDGGAEQVNGPAAAQPLAEAWGGNRLYLNSIGPINTGAFGFTHAAIADGAMSLPEFRDLCEVG